jgi:hypothetical protein
MERVPSRRRRLLSWVPSVALVLLIGAAGLGAVAMSNSWWVQPTAGPAPDQTAPNGGSAFSGAGVDYVRHTGRVVIRMDSEAVPAEQLGLDATGSRRISMVERPVLVQVVGPDGALAVDQVTGIILGTEDGELVSVDLERPVPEGFVQAHRMLTDVADLYGWPEEQVASMPDRFGEARRENPEEPAAITVGPGTSVGLSVTGTLTWDGSLIVYSASPAS